MGVGEREREREGGRERSSRTEDPNAKVHGRAGCL